MKRDGIASDNWSDPAVASPRDESVAGERAAPESIQPQALLARVLERANLQRALKQVRQNKGAPGIDGMTVDELPEYLRHHWPDIRAQLEAGSYCPQPVRRVEIPKPDGKTSPNTVHLNSDAELHQKFRQLKPLRIARPEPIQVHLDALISIMSRG